MKTRTKFIIATFIVTISLSSCRKNRYYPPNFSNGVNYGEEYVVTDGSTIDNTVNMEGGDVVIGGEVKVTADINVKDYRSDVTIADNAIVHKINLVKGTVYLIGSPTINTDFNVHKGGRVIVGNDHSTKRDTVYIGNNFNIADTLLVVGGVLVIETDFNQNSGFINIADSAKIIVMHDMNQGGDIYGAKNLEVRHVYNHNSGHIEQEPIRNRRILNY